MGTLLETFNDKLTTRNFIAIALTLTVVTVILQMTFNGTALLVIVEEKAEWIITGAFIFGALMAKWTDVIQFYFRKPQSNEQK